MVRHSVSSMLEVALKACCAVARSRGRETAMTHFRELTDRYSLEKILRSTRTGTSAAGDRLALRQGRRGQADQRSVAARCWCSGRRSWKSCAALESLRQPSLPTVTDSGLTTEGSAFLVMELLDGPRRSTQLAGPPRAARQPALPGARRSGGPGPPRHRAPEPGAGQPLLSRSEQAAEPLRRPGTGQDPRPREAGFRVAGTAAAETAASAPSSGAGCRRGRGLARRPLPSPRPPARCWECTVGPGESPVVQLPLP